MNRWNRLARVGLIAGMLLISLAPAALQAAGPPPPDAASQLQTGPEQVIMRYQPGTPYVDIENEVRGRGGSILQHIPQLNAVVVQFPVEVGPLSAQSAAGAPEAPFVHAEPNRLRYPTIDPNDTYYAPTGADPRQWGLERIHASAAWDVAKGAGVVIAVLDSGVDLDHPDLAPHLLQGYDLVSRDNQPQDSGLSRGHGTHVAGIANAVTDNGTGIAGVAWDARTLPLRIVDLQGAATSANIAAGIVWAADHDADVINLSLGGLGWQMIERDAVNYAVARGVVVVASAGNDAQAFNYYPASYDHVISVASTTKSDAIASYSNYGEYVDVAAPGGANGLPETNIWSTFDGGGYDYKAGTSMATPHVAGVAALVWSAGHATTPQQVAEAILCSAWDGGAPGYDTVYGYGLLQADAAVTYDPALASSCLPSVPHDDFDAARVIDALPYADTVDTSYATSWEDDPAFCEGTGSRTVWYRFTATESGVLTVSTEGSTYDTVVGVYEGARGKLAQRACNNDYTGTASLARTNVFKGETVAIAVSSYGHEDTPPYTVYRGTLALTATFELFPPPGCRINETGAVICTAE